LRYFASEGRKREKKNEPYEKEKRGDAVRLPRNRLRVPLFISIGKKKKKKGREPTPLIRGLRKEEDLISSALLKR